MVRKSSIYLIFISSLFFLSGQVWSLGLGDIEVDSALNQPLNAQINLISAREDEFEELRVELAPANVFDRVGVPRPYFLTQLKFQPVKLPGGGTAIRVTSKDPVREPFLTFLVEVTWPKGRLLREYTVLLDPPEFAQQQAPQIATPVTTPTEPVVQEQIVEAEPVVEPSAEVSQSTTQVSPQAEIVTTEDDLEKLRAEMDRRLGIDSTSPVEEVVAVEPSAEKIEETVIETVSEVESRAETAVAEDLIEPEEIPGGDSDTTQEIVATEDVVSDQTAEVIEAEVIAESEVYTKGSAPDEVVVESGDTLYAIAKSTTRSNTSINQMMLAIQQANPNAFIKDNVNLLKKGAVLRIPNESEAQNISATEARQQISQQIALWQEYRSNVTQAPAKNVDAPELAKQDSEVAKEAKQALQEVDKKSDTAKSVTEKELNILASEDAKQDANTQLAGGEQLKKLQNEVNLNKELAESRAKENEELKSRVEALESMLEKKEKILNIQNQQLKDLQEQLSTESDKAAAAEKMLQEQADKAEAKQETKPQETIPEKTEAKPVDKPVVEEVKKPVVEPLPEFTDEPTVAEQAVSTPRLEPLPDWDALPEIEPTETQIAEATPPAEPEITPEKTTTETKPAETPPAEVKTVEAPTAPPEASAGVLGFLSSLKERATNALLPLAAGVLLLLGGLWFWKKKQVKTVELTGLGDMPLEAMEDGEHFDDILDETIVTPQTNEKAKASVKQEDLSTMQDLGMDDISDVDTVSDSTHGAELGEDVLDEADVYISYGLHQQAQDLLTEAIAKEPHRNDYKVKLAEVYYSQKDQQGFEQYAEKIKNEVGESSSEWKNIIAMGKELAPASALFAGAAAIGVAAKSTFDKPDEADIDIGLQTAINEPLSDANLEDTIVDQNAEDDDGGLDFNIDDPGQEFQEDDPVASKIMEANETSDILNFDVDDLSDDITNDDHLDTKIDAAATGLHETASMEDLTQELEQIGMQTTMNDLKPLEIDEDDLDLEGSLDDTVAMQSDDLDIDTGISDADPEDTAAYTSSSLGDALEDETEQFDASNIDTEFLDPAEQTVAQTHTDLEELGPPSLIEEVGTKLDLAKAFVDMGDSEAAKETLLEVINEGDESQIKAAKDLMDKLGS